MRPAHHDILFEPLTIGPVTAKNRFYQVPHCTGMGWQRPNTLAAMRGVKAEGGWGVVCTEYCSVHPTSDDGSFPYATLWDKGDVAAHHLMTGKVHAHGGLAGVELWLGGGSIANMATRVPPMGLQDRPLMEPGVRHPGQARRLDRQDIRDLRRWHREAARRAIEAEFDIVYVYATHGYLLSQFLNGATNDRSDEYGGSLENRVRLVRELIEETQEAVAGKAAVATRFSVDVEDAETYDAFGLLADLPDLWDLTVPDYDVEMGVSRFVKEGALTGPVARAKTLTSKPVVAVGRFTSPDTMASVLRAGGQDMIGAARPSIADPFLPQKIEQGRAEDIRECIGCNVCYAYDTLGVPIRCTQNPTMGEEWRQGWHPDRVQPATDKARVLVVGAGPAGLEAARVLGQRGHSVLLAEAARVLGGRVTREAALPGLSEWARVRDWREGQIAKLPNVEIFRESRLSVQDVLDLDVPHVMIATGAQWAEDGVGRHSDTGFERGKDAVVLSAELVMDGTPVSGNQIVIYDDDHYYMGSVLALELRRRGYGVALVTPAGRAGIWGENTQEIHASNAALIAAGVEVVTNRMVTFVDAGKAMLSCVFSGETTSIPCDALLPLTRRIPVCDLYDGLQGKGLTSLRRIGDCEAPSILAAAVHSGYRAAIEFGTQDWSAAYAAKRERPPV